MIDLFVKQLSFSIRFTYSHLQVFRKFLLRENREKQPFLANFCPLFFVQNPLKIFWKFFFLKSKLWIVYKLSAKFQVVLLTTSATIASWIVTILTFSLRNPYKGVLPPLQWSVKYTTTRKFKMANIIFLKLQAYTNTKITVRICPLDCRSWPP